MAKLMYPDSETVTRQMVEWAASHMPGGFTAADLLPCHAIGCVVGRDLVAVVIFNNMRGYMADIGIASSNPSWLTRQVCTHISAFAFVTLRLRRLNAITARANEQARGLAERLGFVFEATLKEAFPNGDDAVVYRMLKPECKWLRSAHAA